jgi:5-methylthioribose kinase
MFNLNAAEPQLLTEYLKKQGWLVDNETICALGKPGEGNMNYVLRVDTGARTFIVKQSRAYVEKYPQVPAPADRALVEGAFYRKIASNTEIGSKMPELLGLDPANNILVLEDLGEAHDYSFLYRPEGKLRGDELAELLAYVHELHQSFFKATPDEELANLAMRKLNHEHIFYFPFLEDNGFDLNNVCAGLQEVAMPYKQDADLKREIHALGDTYLAQGQYLLHGDYYPGSWLKTRAGVKVIDPEFCFYGHREFDLGVLIAHLHLSQQNPDLIAAVKTGYPAYADLDTRLLAQYTGIEIMRRLIGLAQLPLSSDLSTRQKLLAFAHQLITQHEG